MATSVVWGRFYRIIRILAAVQKRRRSAFAILAEQNMETVIHRAGERGGADHGWLKTHHSFSFADWYEPARMGFGALRVLNDDTIAPRSGFGPHPHRDMEIITIVLGGAVTHGDSMGNRGIVEAGDVQVMSAGTGVVHSEENTSEDTPLSLLQLWVEPRERGIAPRYDQKTCGFESLEHGALLLVSPDARDGSLKIHQDAYITFAAVEAQQPLHYLLHDDKHGVYVFVVRGSVQIEDKTLDTRDAMGISHATSILIKTNESAQLLVIEVPLT